MSLKIHQMQITFVPSQDRLMFRVKTTDQTELRLWFTRRYVKLLWQVLQKMLEKTRSELIVDPDSRKAVLSFDHEKAVSGMDFSTPYKEATEANRPLGDEPVLVSKIQVKPGPGKAQVLCLHPEQGQGLELALDPRWIHSFCKLLAQGIKKTDWDLDYGISDTAPPISETTH